jgi:hypothetical protein
MPLMPDEHRGRHQAGDITLRGSDAGEIDPVARLISLGPGRASRQAGLSAQFRRHAPSAAGPKGEGVIP